jgi:TatA/E family protein of Tat protein translocase
LTTFLAWMPGWPEIVLILILVLILFGPRKLPEVADAMGKSIRKFKSASREASDTVQKELDEARRAVEDEPPSPEKPASREKAAAPEDKASPPHQDS